MNRKNIAIINSRVSNFEIENFPNTPRRRCKRPSHIIMKRVRGSFEPWEKYMRCVHSNNYGSLAFFSTSGLRQSLQQISDSISHTLPFVLPLFPLAYPAPFVRLVMTRAPIADLTLRLSWLNNRVQCSAGSILREAGLIPLGRARGPKPHFDVLCPAVIRQLDSIDAYVQTIKSYTTANYYWLHESCMNDLLMAHDIASPPSIHSAIIRDSDSLYEDISNIEIEINLQPLHRYMFLRTHLKEVSSSVIAQMVNVRTCGYLPYSESFAPEFIDHGIFRPLIDGRGNRTHHYEASPTAYCSLNGVCVRLPTYLFRLFENPPFVLWGEAERVSDEFDILRITLSAFPISSGSNAPSFRVYNHVWNGYKICWSDFYNILSHCFPSIDLNGLMKLRSFLSRQPSNEQDQDFMSQIMLHTPWILPAKVVPREMAIYVDIGPIIRAFGSR